jgi:predicted Zn-dependent peptidase
VLAVLNNALGGTASSRLFQEVREERGLAYGVSSWVEAHADAGALCVHTAVEPARFGEAAEVVGRVLEAVAAGGLTDDEIGRARDQLAGSLLLGLESAFNRMSRIATARLYLGRVTPVAEVLAGIAAATPDRVRALARALLPLDRFAVSALGPGDAGAYRVPWAAAPAPTPA